MTKQTPNKPKKRAKQTILSREKSKPKMISLRPETIKVLAELPSGECSGYIEDILWKSHHFRELARSIGIDKKPKRYKNFEGCSHWEET